MTLVIYDRAVVVIVLYCTLYKAFPVKTRNKNVCFAAQKVRYAHQANVKAFTWSVLVGLLKRFAGRWEC